MKNASLSFSDSILSLSKIGQKRYEQFAKLGISTIGDLLTLYPRSYVDYSTPLPIMSAPADEPCVIRGEIVRKLSPARIRSSMTVFKVIVTDGMNDMTVTIYNTKFLFDSLYVGESYLFYGKVSGSGKHREMSSPLLLNALSDDKIMPIYPLTEGLTQNVLRSAVKEALRRTDDFCDVLPQEVRQSYGVAAYRYALENVHFPRDMGSAGIARERLIFEELFMLALGMKTLKNRRKSETAHVIAGDCMDEFARSLPFELTGAQRRSIKQCAEDMRSGSPMNRLLQGDVGSGKTAVAAACAYMAAKNGFQTALMAPTEILAAQHYNTLVSFLEPLGVSVCLLTGSMTAKQKSQTRELLESGECFVAVGTHALFQKSVSFKSLGLVITDEQHRFGVEQRAGLAEKGKDPHRLIMSATPIPRTLALMVFGDLDISVLDELPKGRIPIKTYAMTGKIRERAFGFVRQQLEEGRQCYIVCPMIEESEMPLKSVKKYADDISRRYFGGFRIGVLHGKLAAAEKDAIMLDFKEHRLDILVSTTVIEVGVDVANASVMVVENADRFGLSQLHQLRGRVGRGAWQSYCILITDNPTPECKERLETMAHTSDGFKISEEDLKMRGPGEFFGSRQHGLPRLKIADMMNDMDIMKKAQSAAQELIAGDGLLQSREHAALRAAVERLFEKGPDL